MAWPVGSGLPLLSTIFAKVFKCLRCVPVLVPVRLCALVWFRVCLFVYVHNYYLCAYMHNSMDIYI